MGKFSFAKKKLFWKSNSDQFNTNSPFQALSALTDLWNLIQKGSESLELKLLLTAWVFYKLLRINTIEQLHDCVILLQLPESFSLFFLVQIKAIVG